MMLVYPAVSPLGALLSALIVVLSAAGLTIHSDFYAGIRRTDYWVYYTNLSNLAIFLYFSLLGPILYSLDPLNRIIPHAEFALMMSIMLTHFVFHLMIFPQYRTQAAHAPHTREYDIVRADNAIEHYIVPWITFGYWLLCSPGKAQLGPWDALGWLVFPLVYLVFILVRARLRGKIAGTQSAFPYPFLDIDALGQARVMKTCTQLMLFWAIISLCIVFAVQTAALLFFPAES